ncbi:hypothetical protein SCBWM1_gp9 [Synechococcus phage S-CBWM1]|uniref:Glycosyltransferase n=1 Tax=Synechococcus phage S-CBWM1 TaxID=2053653 RepID=A0A3G1L3B7_9CAUD|nr:hypothetical protein HOU61_gp010 [Synechococcus phage S-CBWM1]ATW62693.1 hypothetical protein SCBWM1_gp9 [Synechococcus phage S-CBWM1]
MKNYQIAIPTYGRPEGVKKHTLSYLERTDVPKDRIFLFVANEEEQEKYAEVNQAYADRIVVGVKGLCPQRQFISDYFPKGTPVLSMDDDVSAVRCLRLGEPLKGTQKPLKHPCSLAEVTNLSYLIDLGYSLTENAGLRMWGVYQVDNKGFLHPKITTGLKFVMGHFVAFYAGDPVFDEIASFPMKDDFFWSLRHYQEHGGTLRFDNIAVKAKQHSGAGGTCEDMEKKLEINNSTVDLICEEFSELASPKMRKTQDPWLSRYKELRLKTITTSTQPAHELEDLLP